MGKLTVEDLQRFRTDSEVAINLIRIYSSQYKGAFHYDQLGASCAMSITKTIDTIIGSAQYLDGHFVIPDEIHIDRVIDWFMQNRFYPCEREPATIFAAHYLKRKVNAFYRSVRNGSVESTLTIAGNSRARKELERYYKLRDKQDVKIIRS